jgi:hypothetical protein
MGEMRNACNISVRKSVGNSPLGESMHRWENNAKIDLKQDKRGWTELVWLLTGTNGSCEHDNEPLGSKNGQVLLTEQLLASHKELCSVESVIPLVTVGICNNILHHRLT